MALMPGDVGHALRQMEVRGLVKSEYGARSERYLHRMEDLRASLYRALRWGVYRAGELAGARYGLLEPAGPSLDPSVIAESRVIVVPALAVQHDGARLGRGAGFYDRSLPLADPSALLIAVVRDDEVLDDVPTGAHDVTMTHIATPAGGVRPCR